MSNRIVDLTGRTYPQTWLLVDLVSERPRVLGQEVVDLSPGAIELRSVAREMSRYAENPEHWRSVADGVAQRDLPGGHRRKLSFGPEISYCVERDTRGGIHGGRPFRHLALTLRDRVLTPATSAEIALYFYGARRATLALTDPAQTHGYIGLAWEELGHDDLGWLVRRESPDV
ncbi:MAG: hypothetical protein V3U86_09310 [Acidobacteriota bacterium]